VYKYICFYRFFGKFHVWARVPMYVYFDLECLCDNNTKRMYVERPMILELYIEITLTILIK
jgi:hypothetical protein